MIYQTGPDLLEQSQDTTDADNTLNEGLAPTTPHTPYTSNPITPQLNSTKPVLNTKMNVHSISSATLKHTFDRIVSYNIHLSSPHISNNF